MEHNSAENRCTVCGKPNSRACMRCKDSPSANGTELSSTFYCGKECQKVNYTEHKDNCVKLNMRRTLFRAVDTTQQAFLNFREHGFEYKLLGSNKIGSTITIFRAPRSPSHIAAKFDGSVLSDPNDRSAVLTALCCSEGLAYTRELFIAAAGGIATTIEELMCRLQNHRLQLVYGGIQDKVPPKEFNHEVFLVTLKSKEKYIVDFTGQQYGFSESILPASDYISSRVKKIIGKEPHGSRKLQQMGMVMDPKPRINAELAILLDGHYSLAMDEALVAWEKSPDRKLQSIILLPEDQYLAKRNEFLEYLRGGLVKCREDLVERGLIRYSSDGSTMATKRSSRLVAEFPEIWIDVDGKSHLFVGESLFQK